MSDAAQPTPTPTPTPENLCIEAKKVYDWCFSLLTPPPFNSDLKPINEIAGHTVALVACEVTAVTCQEIGPRTPVSGSTAIVHLAKLVTITYTFFEIDEETGLLVPIPTEEPVTETRVFTEDVQLCAPPGTDIACHFSSATCTVGSFEQPGKGANITIKDVTVTICQSLQSTATVKVCISATFCTPHACPPINPPCPPDPPFFPAQCPTGPCTRAG